MCSNLRGIVLALELPHGRISFPRGFLPLLNRAKAFLEAKVMAFPVSAYFVSAGKACDRFMPREPVVTPCAEAWIEMCTLTSTGR